MVLLGNEPKNLYYFFRWTALSTSSPNREYTTNSRAWWTLKISAWLSLFCLGSCAYLWTEHTGWETGVFWWARPEGWIQPHLNHMEEEWEGIDSFHRESIIGGKKANVHICHLIFFICHWAMLSSNTIYIYPY